MKCPNCGKDIPKEVLAAEMGRSKSAKKSAASRENGKKGGRPRKEEGK